MGQPDASYDVNKTMQAEQLVATIVQHVWVSCCWAGLTLAWAVPWLAMFT